MSSRSGSVKNYEKTVSATPSHPPPLSPALNLLARSRKLIISRTVLNSYGTRHKSAVFEFLPEPIGSGPVFSIFGFAIETGSHRIIYPVQGMLYFKVVNFLVDYRKLGQVFSHAPAVSCSYSMNRKERFGSEASTLLKFS